MSPLESDDSRRRAGHRRAAALLAALGAVTIGAASFARSDCTELLIPAYLYPTVGPFWSDITAAAAGGARLTIIANPASGPGVAPDPNYTAVINAARSSGARVIGYVPTTFGARPAVDVIADAQTFASFYAIDGIFLDEMDNTAASLAYYQSMTGAIHTAMPGALVVGNPGTSVPEPFVSGGAADVIVTYENNAAGPLSPYSALMTPAWVFGYPARRFGHIVYNVTDAAAMQSTLALAEARNVGWVFVTDGVLPNPYDHTPPFWSHEVALAPGRRAGDANRDGSVGLGDIAVLTTNWAQTAPPAPASADLDGSGDIGLGDIAVVVQNWATSCP